MFEDVRQQEGGSIICFFAGSEGNAFAEFTRELMKPLRGQAERIATIDIGSSNWASEFQDVLSKGPVWFAASFFGPGQDAAVSIDDRQVNFWEWKGIPFVRFFGDIPAYFPDRHARNSRSSVNGYFHSSHATYCRKWIQSPGIPVLLPPVLFDEMPLDEINVERKLKGKIIFPKNGNSPASLLGYWQQHLPDTLNEALLSLGEESIGAEWIDREPEFDRRLIDYFHSKGLDISAQPAVLSFLVAQLDDYVRRIKSTMIGEAISDLPVILRGRFWEHVDFTGKRLQYDPNSDVAATLALIDQAPAILDMSPNTQQQPHDRIYRALGRGTAFLTNRQTFLNNKFDSPERFSFRFERDEIRRCVEHYVENPKEAVELGYEQSRVLRPCYSGDEYCKTLVAAVQLCAFSLSGRPEGTQSFVAYPSYSFE